MFATLKKRAEFLRVRGGARYETPAFVIEAKARPSHAVSAAVEISDAGHVSPDHLAQAAQARFGFTVTKKLGNAVARNRIRRRLREMIRLTAPRAARTGVDYVLIARGAAATRDFAVLRQDCETALQRIGARLDGPAPSRPPPQRSGAKPRQRQEKQPQ